MPSVREPWCLQLAARKCEIRGLSILAGRPGRGNSARKRRGPSASSSDEFHHAANCGTDIWAHSPAIDGNSANPTGSIVYRDRKTTDPATGDLRRNRGPARGG